MLYFSFKENNEVTEGIIVINIIMFEHQRIKGENWQIREHIRIYIPLS